MISKSVAIDSVTPYNKNPRKGNVAEIKKSLVHNGQYRPIVIQASTQQILVGNHTWKAAKELGWQEISIVEIDVDDEKAKKILLADNRYADLGNYDTEALLTLLGEVGYDGTGYEAQDFEALNAHLGNELVNDTEAHFENVVIGKSMAERASTYAERAERLLMCEYSLENYQWIMERLAEVRDKFNADNNTQAILLFLEEYTESEYPRNVNA